MTTITEYDHTTDMMRVGMVLPNGETVIAFRTMSDYRLCDDGYYNYFVYHVVCVRGGENYHNYSDRFIFAKPDGWAWGGGDYTNDIHEALRRMEGDY